MASWKKKIVSAHSDIVEVHDFKETVPAIWDSVDNLTRSCIIECRHTEVKGEEAGRTVVPMARENANCAQVASSLSSPSESDVRLADTLIDRGGQEAGVPCLAGPPACWRPHEQLVHAWFIENGRGSSESPFGGEGRRMGVVDFGGWHSDVKILMWPS